MTECEIVEVEGMAARCRGKKAAGHLELEIVVSFGQITTCPLCGARFRRREAPTVGPAAWLKEE